MEEARRSGPLARVVRVGDLFQILGHAQKEAVVRWPLHANYSRASEDVCLPAVRSKVQHIYPVTQGTWFTLLLGKICSKIELILGVQARILFAWAGL
jgi:hypothetical protein